MLEMDDPEHRAHRTPLNAYLSPAAVQRWVPSSTRSFRACLDEKIGTGRIDLRRRSGQHRARHVLTLAHAGRPAAESGPICGSPPHASVYTPATSPDYVRVADLAIASAMDMMGHLAEIRERPDPG